MKYAIKTQAQVGNYSFSGIQSRFSFRFGEHFVILPLANFDQESSQHVTEEELHQTEKYLKEVAKYLYHNTSGFNFTTLMKAMENEWRGTTG